MALKVQGQGTGAAQAVQDFLNMLRRCSGLTLNLNAQTGAITEGATAGNPPAARSAADPSATTRCEVLVHVIAEYAFALRAGTSKCRVGFHKAHKAGLRAQAAYRRANGQGNALPHRNDLVNGPPRAVVFRHCDRTRTIAVQDRRTGGIRVRHTRPRRRRTARVPRVVVPRFATKFQPNLESHAFAFVGTIEEVERAPGVFSDFGLSHHAVVYRDVEWLKGGLSEASARVHHLCVRDAATVDKRGGLNKRLFVPGRRIVVFCDLAADPEVRGGVRLEVNEPDTFVELCGDSKETGGLTPDFLNLVT